MISAILLAAGEAKRMGAPKLLLRAGEKTIIEQSLENLLGSKVDEVIVVLGHKSEEIRKLIGHQPFKLVENPDYAEGMSTSISAGLKQIGGDRTVLIALADQPLIDSQTINQLIEAFQKHHKGIVIPTYQGKRGHPVIFSLKYRDELLALQGDVGAREIVANHSDDILEVPVSAKGVIIDIDTRKDYETYLG